MPDNDTIKIESNSVSIKLPTFWTIKAEIWFLQAESQFNIAKITVDETKYYNVLAALDQDTATKIQDLLQQPPEKEKYVTIKHRLLDTFTLSESSRATALLNIYKPPGLGDRNPLELMDQMLALLGTHSPDFLFKEMQCLPADIRLLLIRSKITDCRQLAQAANELYNAVAQATYAVKRFQNSSKPLPSPSTIKEHPVQTDQVSSNCFYHQTYGSRARQCRPPCTFASGNKQTGRQ